ncbi:amphi-Trp domain-containing protein [Haloplanus vescus]|uniref:Amphi-Trp domain-containing protein n=1 Tax=Haloplanus vescus TaxID=555874 RepID=A0A1H3VPJ9_9EURY|nr:HVO_2922 family protein [Haloplanus vescus]SDZ76745.1 amphi-Trp domain-containing protein [Haloplanus vescus]
MSEEYESEIAASRADIAAVLCGIVDGITTGSLQLSDEDESIVVDIPDELTLEIEFETDGGDLSLELEMEWSQPAVEGDGATEKPSEDDAETTLPVGAADASATLARFEVFRDRGGEWRWRLRHRNGNIIATSGESYTRKHNARKGLQSVVRNAPDAEVTDETLTE